MAAKKKPIEPTPPKNPNARQAKPIPRQAHKIVRKTSAADFRMKEEADKRTMARTDSQGRTGMGATSQPRGMGIAGNIVNQAKNIATSPLVNTFSAAKYVAKKGPVTTAKNIANSSAANTVKNIATSPLINSVSAAKYVVDKVTEPKKKKKK